MSAFANAFPLKASEAIKTTKQFIITDENKKDNFLCLCADFDAELALDTIYYKNVKVGDGGKEIYPKII